MVGLSRKQITRREFLKISALGLGSLGLRPWRRLFDLTDFPQTDRLGRVVQMVNVKAKPDFDSQTVGVLYEDAVVPWVREIVSPAPKVPAFNNLKWVETPDGYIFGNHVQPVRNMPNQPVSELRSTSMGQGMWVEVTVPYVDVILDKAPSSNSWVINRIDEGLPVRLYYGQIFWIDSIKEESGEVFYRVNPNYYGGVDMMWAPGEAFRPVADDELSQINPEVEDKRIVIDLNHQTMSCYERNTEVFYCRISSGGKYNYRGEAVDSWSTPVGRHRVSRKYISLQMSGGTTGAGYDLPGIGWTSIFVTGGVAVHSTFWHNGFGDPLSHGCVNARPDDAKWVFRWTTPGVPYDPGMMDVTLTGESSTTIEVIEG